MILKACGPYPPPGTTSEQRQHLCVPDESLATHLLHIIECVAADAAADEQKVGTDLRDLNSIMPNLLHVGRDHAHAFRRQLQTQNR